MTNSIERRFLPWWVWAIIAIEVVVPTYFGIATIFDPSIWGEESFGAIGQLYVTRNFTMVLAIIIAALMRNHTALLVTIFARYVTDLVDIVSGFIRGPDAATMQVLAVFGFLLLVPPLFALIWLFQRRAGTR